MFKLNKIIGQIFKLGAKKAVWKKVTELKTGVKIAIEKNGRLEWDEIVSIKKVGRERVYDIEVEGTHNFVGNGIIAHNTKLDGITLTDTGDLNISQDNSGNYQLTNTSNNSIIDRIGAYAQLVAANIRAGLIESQIIKTNIISPIANADLIIDLQPDNSEVASQLIIKGENDEVVTSFDAEGNARLDSIMARQATISGTLYANNIESERLNAIEELLTEVESNQALLTEASLWNTDTATASGQFTDLFVTGQTAMTSLFISDLLTVNKIESLDMPLQIQSLAASPLEIMAGKIIIDTNGNTKFLGDVEIAGNLKINNIIVANNIDPIATESGTLIEGEITTNAVAGTATLPAGLTELIIKNEKLKINSLIYVTPVSSTQNKVLYVKSKDVGVFTIGFNEAIDTDVEFNWWIIDLEPVTVEELR